MYDSAVQTDLQANSYAIPSVLKLWMVPGGVYELRCPDTRRGVISGYFNDPEALAFHAEQLSGNCPAVFLSLNPINPLFLYRLSNKVKPYSKDTVTDDGVIRRTRLLIDSDAKLPIKNISSSEEEHEAALAGAREVRDWLATRGWPDPIYADSGNGGHLQYAIDLPNDEQHKELLSKFLMTIKGQFPNVEIDPTVFNASRICKVYGTMVCKGENMPDRPHRLARILEAPEQLSVVPVEFIHAVVGQPAVVSVQAAGPVHATSPAEAVDTFEQKINAAPVEWPKDYDGDLRTLDIVKLFASRDLLIRESDGQSAVLCPWRDEHTTGDSGTAIWRNADGYPGFHCLHQHCKDRGLQEVLAWFGRSAVDAHCTKVFGNPEVVRERERLAKDADLAEQIVARSQVGVAEHVVATSLEAEPEAFCEVDDFMDKSYKLQDTPAASTYRFKPLSASDFAQATYSLEWLVTNMLVKNQPCIIGGPKKALKTSILVDLAISLGSGEPFLGYFPLQRTRTVLISGESGDFTLQETAKRICLAKGISLADTDTLWDFRLPQLSVPEELDELKRGLDRHRVEVAIIDPLYLCLLAGQSEGKSASNLFDMGPLLMQVSRACLDVGCTPLLVHHAKKFTATGEALDLEALAFAGVQEFARQWLLLSRREAYQPGTGVHRLYLSAGGSAGHSSLHGLDVYEGVLSSDFTGRTWKVEILNLDKVKEQKAMAAELLKQDKAVAEQNALLKILDGNPAGITKTRLKETLPWGDDKFYKMLARMEHLKLVRVEDGEITVGKGARRRVAMVYKTDHPTRISSDTGHPTCRGVG